MNESSWESETFLWSQHMAWLHVAPASHQHKTLMRSLRLETRNELYSSLWSSEWVWWVWKCGRWNAGCFGYSLSSQPDTPGYTPYVCHKNFTRPGWFLPCQGLWGWEAGDACSGLTNPVHCFLIIANKTRVNKQKRCLEVEKKRPLVWARLWCKSNPATCLQSV